MNRFAIEEDDQFEINVKDYKDEDFKPENEVMYNASEEVLRKAQQGWGYFRYKLRIIK